MGKIKLRVPYKGWWYIVILPTLEFLLCLFLIPYFAAVLQGDEVNDWIMFGAIIISIPVGLGIAVVTYPLLLKLAGKKYAEIKLENNIVSYITGTHWKSVDFSKPHSLVISGGISPVYSHQALGITINDKKNWVNFFIKNLSGNDFLQHFPAAFFVLPTVISPAEGLPGFEMDCRDDNQKSFALQLLDLIWINRNNNKYFLFANKLPWNRKPAPAFTYIKTYRWKLLDEVSKNFITRLKSEVIVEINESLKLTPDYLLGLEWYSGISYLLDKDFEPDIYYVMPLGYFKTEELIPSQDYSNYSIVTGVNTMLNQSVTSSSLIRNVYRIRITGKGEDGKSLKLEFEWIGPTDDNYWEAQYTLRFINRKW